MPKVRSFVTVHFNLYDGQTYVKKKGSRCRTKNGPLVTIPIEQRLDPLLISYVRKNKISFKKVDIIDRTTIIVRS